MGLFSKKNQITFAMEDGLDNIKKGSVVTLTLLDDGLTIKQNLTKNVSHLKYGQITNIGTVKEEEIIEKNKSVIGRAVVGDLLLGPLGAVVGGMSGIGTKQKKKSRLYFIINYDDDDDDDDGRVLSFLVTGNTMGLPKFKKELNERIGL